jgi:glycosyltransferase involved in cell wall biosynthesis
VLASDLPCHREIAGDGVLYAVPWDVRDLRDRMTRLLAEPALRARLSADSRTRAADLTWDRTARSVLDAYAAVGR